MSRRQFVAFLTTLYSHKLWNSKFEGDKATQDECFERVEDEFEVPANQMCIKAIMMQLISLNVAYQLRELRIF
jgi:hypothetical protein